MNLAGPMLVHLRKRSICFIRLVFFIHGMFSVDKSLMFHWMADFPSFSGCRPSLVAVDDIVFRKPVEIGSLLLLSSQVIHFKDRSWLFKHNWHYLYPLFVLILQTETVMTLCCRFATQKGHTFRSEFTQRSSTL